MTEDIKNTSSYKKFALKRSLSFFLTAFFVSYVILLSYKTVKTMLFELRGNTVR